MIEDRRPRSVHPIDAYVGRRIRVRRKQRGLTQTALAKHIGVTFQQVQKYEHGTNRVASARLAAIAAVLEVPVGFFFPAENARELLSSLDELYSNQIAAAQAATEAATKLLGAVRNSEPVPVDEVLALLMSAARLIAETENRQEVTELLVAIHRWSAAHR